MPGGPSLPGGPAFPGDPTPGNPGLPGIPGFPGNPGAPVGPSFPSRPSRPVMKRNLKLSYSHALKKRNTVLDQVSRKAKFSSIFCVFDMTNPIFPGLLFF